jgi:hypothetical protein
MKARGAAIQGTLALVGLVAAYATWQRQPEKAAGSDVVVLDIGRNDLERVRYQDGPKSVDLERRSEGSEKTLWLHLATREAASDGGTSGPDGGTVAAAPESRVPEREVRGNDQAEKLCDKFAPLRASRSLGVLDEAKRRELGLEASKKRLEVFARGGKHASYVVSVSALGAGAPYLQGDQDNRVFLLGSSIASDLDAASTRLVDRRLHVFKPADYDSLTLKVEDKQREFVQISAETNQPQKLAAKKTPTKPDDFARNWHDKIWHLVVTEVLGKGEVPNAGEPKVAIRVDYSRRGKPVGWIEVSQPQKSSAGPVADMFARTEHTAGWVKVHAVAEDLLKEGKKIASEQ